MPNWKKVIVSGSDAALNSLNVTAQFTASGLNYPNADGVSNQVLKTNGAGNLFFDNVITTTISIKNVSGGTITKGTPCYITGSGTSGNVIGVWPADASNPLRMPAGVIAGETLADGAEGVGLLNGFINGVDTSAFNAGDSVYVKAGGGYTNVRPTGSSVLIQKLGNVEKVDASNGSGVINGPGYYNDLPNVQQGYTWVGNSNGVATATATSSIQNVVSSSFASTVESISSNITNNTDNRVLTATGGGNINGEANMTFDGSLLNVIGTIRATVKSFIIDHPTKKGKKLQYGVLEGPEHSVFVRGQLINKKIITLPDYWHALVDKNSITINLTAVGKKQELWVDEITDTYVKVGSDLDTINCFYTVFAERKDVDKLITEFNN